jgi:hypothetical protein
MFSDEKGLLRKEQLQAMKARVENDLNSFEDQYSYLVRDGVTDMSSAILERNGELFIEIEGSKKLIDLLQDKVLAQAINLKEKDGLILSDRIWRLTQEAKADIIARLQQGMLLGESHVKVAKDIREYIKGGGLKYKSERLVQSEMAKAYKRANEMSVEAMRQNSEFVWFEKWELSSAHPAPDVCDILATQDLGEGPGVYESAPNRHPGCFCYIYPVYRERRTKKTYPNVSGKEPKTEDLPASQHKLAKELT